MALRDLWSAYQGDTRRPAVDGGEGGTHAGSFQSMIPPPFFAPNILTPADPVSFSTLDIPGVDLFRPVKYSGSSNIPWCWDIATLGGMSDTPTYTDADALAIPSGIQRQVDELAARVSQSLNLPPLVPGWKWRIDSEVVGEGSGMVKVRFSATPEKVVYFRED